MTRHFLTPAWVSALRYGLHGLLSLLYLRRRLEESGLYPAQVGDTTILQLMDQRWWAFNQGGGWPKRWKGGPDDATFYTPEGWRTWWDRDLLDFRALCEGRKDHRLSICHAHAAMVRTGRMDPIPPDGASK